MLTEMTTKINSSILYTSHKLLVTVRVFTDNNTCAVGFIKTIRGGGGCREEGGVFSAR